jgi:hypothetical protein
MPTAGDAVAVARTIGSIEIDNARPNQYKLARLNSAGVTCNSRTDFRGGNP